MGTKNTQTTKLDRSEMMRIEFYTVENAAEKLNLKPDTIRKAFNEGRLNGYKKSGRVYFLHSDLVDFITSG